MVEYFKLYKESSGKTISYYIPIKKIDDSTLGGFVLDHKWWRYDDQLVEPEAWEEEFISDTNYTKILDIRETPKKRELFKVVFNNEI